LILSFDLDASLRRLTPHKKAASLTRRDDCALIFIDDVDLVGPDLLIDTTVTIDVVQNRAPLKVDQLLAARTVHHSTVALSELTYLFGRLDPKHPNTAAAQKAMKKALDRIPDHRLTAPTQRISGEAGILSGMVARLTNRSQSNALLNDALLHCQAIAQGLVFLTGNISDFDLFDQVLPGRIIVYRK
jgi:predicted nucleic acid-binding protein